MSESRFTFMINGKEYPAVSGQKILEVARRKTFSSQVFAIILI